MPRPRGRTPRFTGPVLNIRMPALLRLKLHAAAQAQERSVSDLVRTALEQKFGSGDKGGNEG